MRYLALQNGDDPIPKFGAEVVWRRPPWLGPEEQRPRAPARDQLDARDHVLRHIHRHDERPHPDPGDLRRRRPRLPRRPARHHQRGWRLPRTQPQRDRIEWALRLRERAWEINRRWAAANAKSGDERDQARQEVLTTLGKWRGEDGPTTEDDLEELLRVGLQPEPPATGPLPVYPKALTPGACRAQPRRLGPGAGWRGPGPRRRRTTQVKLCPASHGVVWRCASVASRSKPSANKRARSSAEKRAVGNPEHCRGPSGANVPITRAPPGSTLPSPRADIGVAVGPVHQEVEDCAVVPQEPASVGCPGADVGHLKLDGCRVAAARGERGGQVGERRGGHVQHRHVPASRGRQGTGEP